MAGLVELPELREISFEQLAGNFKLPGGGALSLSHNLESAAMDVESEGSVGLDGRLDLPITIYLSPELSARLAKRSVLAGYLADEGGRTTLHLRLAGTLNRPKPILDKAGVTDQVKGAVSKKAPEKIGERLGGMVRKHLMKMRPGNC